MQRTGHRVRAGSDMEGGRRRASCFRTAAPWALGAAAWGLAAWLASAPATASEVILKDGRVLKGKVSETAGLAESNNISDPEAGHIKQIIFVLDELRRTYISKRQLQEVRADNTSRNEENFDLRQPTTKGNIKVSNVGTLTKVGNFDEFGRRNVTIQTGRGPVIITQAITEMTPQWVKVEGLNYIWDMRIATTTIPRATLQKILMNQIDPKNIEHRKKIARFYLQSERYEEARQTLEDIVNDKDLAAQTNVGQQLQPMIRALRQMSAQRELAELKLRSASGQHELVKALLKKFPTDDVAGDILQAVREMLDQYDAAEARRVQILKDCDALIAQVKDTGLRRSAEKVREGLGTEMNVDTLPRMAAFQQNLADPQLAAEDKVSLALSGWLLGADGATPKLALTASAYRVRELTQKYLAEPIKLHRTSTFQSLASEPAATPALLAGLIKTMKPPIPLPDGEDPEKPGYYRLEVVGLPKEAPVTYYVQLPSEYNPYRRYPMIVTLHSLFQDPEIQLDWWTGPWVQQRRVGHSSRNGYIVISPEWAEEHQKEYEFSAREHVGVLNTVRDACRRFAVDTDRIFLTGHSQGGDAAWDIGLAHPDVWAGVIPIAAESQKYCMFYWENARNLPLYVIEGELDGGRLARSARDLDRCLRRGFNTTVVEYLGRGHDHFADEQLRLFDWMGRFHRDGFPREFNCTTMRPWDNRFWWAEMDGMPPASMINPATWPPPRGTQPLTIKGSMMAANNLSLRAVCSRATVWLAPQMIDFQKRVNILVNGHRATGAFVDPSIETLLEDVRVRGDRQHPYWAKIEVSSGK